MIVTPEIKRIIVFKIGKSNGLIEITPAGGQLTPNSILGLKLELKKAQKKLKKNITSLIINKIIATRMLVLTILV